MPLADLETAGVAGDGVRGVVVFGALTFDGNSFGAPSKVRAEEEVALGVVDVLIK